MLLPVAGPLGEADEALAPLVTEAVLREVTDLVPDEWLEGDDTYPTPEQARHAYVDVLLERVSSSRTWLDAVEVLRAARV